MGKDNVKNLKDEENKKKEHVYSEAGEANEGEEQIKILELEEKVKELENKWKRALADYQNQEKWVREKKSEWIKSANKDLLLRILPVLDTLYLAALHTEDKNIQISIDQFLVILKDEGVTRIEALGKEFDPFLMEAISTENGKENVVVKELRTGYKLFESVLRPAQVIVGNGE